MSITAAKLEKKVSGNAKAGAGKQPQRRQSKELGDPREPRSPGRKLSVRKVDKALDDSPDATATNDDSQSNLMRVNLMGKKGQMSYSRSPRTDGSVDKSEVDGSLERKKLALNDPGFLDQYKVHARKSDGRAGFNKN